MKKQLLLIAVLWLASSTQLFATELRLALKLPAQAGEYHNPYVAVWIEDTNGKSARTLVLWREGAKWLKDIRRWWRKVGRKDADFVDGITSATRAAGHYKLNFDALDDKGAPLANGNYILRIEVVRENGSRAMLKQPFTLNGKAQQYTLAATSETAKSIFTIKE